MRRHTRSGRNDPLSHGEGVDHTCEDQRMGLLKHNGIIVKPNTTTRMVEYKVLKFQIQHSWNEETMSLKFHYHKLHRRKNEQTSETKLWHLNRFEIILESFLGLKTGLATTSWEDRPPTAGVARQKKVGMIEDQLLSTGSGGLG
jgi:hypothetical protein